MTAAVASVVAAAAHLACIAGGPEWYRFFGAGEQMVRMAEAGWWTPAIWTLGIASILLGWALWAFSGAGLVRRVPLLRTGLVAITATLLLRAIWFFVPGTWILQSDPVFMAWSSGIVFILGLIFGIGTFMAWPTLSKASQ